jgi:molybdopterin-containing oxidoreductase family membrane subunit
MLEKALHGSSKYWALLGFLLVFIVIGVATYLRQFSEGLTITGLSRDVPWGFYISQFTFMVGVAASAVMVVLPYYLHNYKVFGKVVILGEMLAISSMLMCMLFIFVDMGQPTRVLNIALHPTPNSPMFWDMISVFGYLGLNSVIAWVTFGAERKGVAPPKWIKPVIILSIPWAVSIHTVTAFLYSGLEARHFWLTAILAPRFLASAFSAGPSILIILCLILRRFTSFDVGKEAIQTLGKIVTYAMAVNVFFVLVELFTALYSDIPAHVHHFAYMYQGHDGHGVLVPWMTVSTVLSIVGLLMLLFPQVRRKEGALAVACIAVVAALWIEKGLGLVITGFLPSPLGYYNEYWPTTQEVLIGLGVYGIGFFVLTVLYKIAVGVREET